MSVLFFKMGFMCCAFILDWNGLGWVICDLGSDSILIFLVSVWQKDL